MARMVWALLFATVLSAASLKQESADAWERYWWAAQSNAARHAEPSAGFLWVDESRQLRERVHNGEIVVAETGGALSKKVPNALIHDWIGVAFIPGARIEDVIAVVRDYGRYKEFYPPAVIRSKAIEQSQYADRFIVLMMNSSLVGKTALEVECHSRYKQLSDKRWYAISEAVRIQEIDNFGRPDERRLPIGAGGGYIWRLASITRFEERDGGVYLEVEALGLSRDIPSSLHFAIDPIVRRLSRSSLTESLRQTGHAVGEVVASNSPVLAASP